MTDHEPQPPSGYGVFFALSEEDTQFLVEASERLDDDEIHAHLDALEEDREEPWICPMDTIWSDVDAVLQAGKRMSFATALSARLAEGVMFLPAHSVPHVAGYFDLVEKDQVAQWMVLAGLEATEEALSCLMLWFEAARLFFRRAASVEHAVAFRVRPDEMDLDNEIKLQ